MVERATVTVPLLGEVSTLNSLAARLDRLIRLLELSFRVGTATGASEDKLVDSTKAWDDNIWVGDEVEILAGSGQGQIRVIKGNTKTSLTVDPWDEKPTSGSVYRLQPSERPITRLSLMRQNIVGGRTIGSGLKFYRATRLRLMVSMSATGIVSVGYTRSGITEARQLNSGQALVANSLYVFDLLADGGDEITIQYGVDATIQVLTVHEIARGNA